MNSILVEIWERIRRRLIFSVDPPGCVDADDAMSGKEAKEWLRIVAHIADVSFFVLGGNGTRCGRQGEGHDRLSSKRAHRHVTRNTFRKSFCSLLEGQDRLAVSCVWNVDENLNNEGKPWFGRSIIRNRKAIDYYSAQALLDEGVAGRANNMRDFYDALRILTNFANKRRVREMNGALELASAELWFETHADAGDHEELSTTAVAEKRDVSTMKNGCRTNDFGDRAAALNVHIHKVSRGFVRSPTPNANRRRLRRYEKILQRVFKFCRV